MTDSSMEQQAAESESNAPYQVLARKYRPATFRDLIGQDALVRTLTNAMETGRLAHAFILTGVRGVGKTTSARIIAKALNCTGVDGNGEATPDPCGVCESCQAIAQDRHVDVMEMDAASRTGVGDVRELIESVRYRPVSARKKVYIIDEVHMLSNSAFNALLKTLEEPPEHVVFIFATTEIRKVPVTVLSRCQRFDLRRVEHGELVAHFARILDKEGVQADEEALGLLARAADGSVRDGLSLVDQAIALGGGAAIETEAVRHMLGLADRTRIFDLFDSVMRGESAQALEILGDLYNGGADPVVVMQDMLELSHLLTRAKLVPETLSAPGIPEAERVRGGEMSEKLSLAILARAWQMLLKGLGEVQSAPHPLQATEMVIIRLAYTSDLPTPGDLVKKLKDTPADSAPAGRVGNGASAPAGGANGGYAAARGGMSAGQSGGHGGGAQAVARALPDDEAENAPSAPSPSAQSSGPSLVVDNTVPPAGPAFDAPVSDGGLPSLEEQALASPQTFREVINLARERGQRILSAYLANDVHLIKFAPGLIEYRPANNAPRDLAAQLERNLLEWTGQRWEVKVSRKQGVDTIRAQERQISQELDEKALQDPFVQAVLRLFPGAKMVERKGLMPDEFVVEGLVEEPMMDGADDPDLDIADLDERVGPQID